MKKILLFTGIILIVSSCVMKKVNFDQLQNRDGLFYMVNDKEPFSGEIISYVHGKVEFEGNVQNGLKEGLWVYYYTNGQKMKEGVYKDGLKEGTWTYWAENGEQDNTEVYKVGTKLGNEEGLNKKDQFSGEDQGDQSEEEVVPEKKQKDSNLGGTIGGGNAAAKPEQEVKKKPKAVNWKHLSGGPVKYYQGKAYTGPVIKYYLEGARGKYIYGHFTNGHRSGKWTFYYRDGRVKDIKYY